MLLKTHDGELVIGGGSTYLTKVASAYSSMKYMRSFGWTFKPSLLLAIWQCKISALS